MSNIDMMGGTLSNISRLTADYLEIDADERLTIKEFAVIALLFCSSRFRGVLYNSLSIKNIGNIIIGCLATNVMVLGLGACWLIGKRSK